MTTRTITVIWILGGGLICAIIVLLLFPPATMLASMIGAGLGFIGIRYLRLPCRLGYHSWLFCKCQRCGNTKGDSHNWDGCTCSVCGLIQHKWDKCKCSVCGEVRHHWDGCRCTICGEQQHDWRTDSGSWGRPSCICRLCGATRDEGHDFGIGCKCARCGAIHEDRHRWRGCECADCGKVRDEGHDWSRDCGRCRICGATRRAEHDWCNDCRTCAKCGKTRAKMHVWHDGRCRNCEWTLDTLCLALLVADNLRRGPSVDDSHDRDQDYEVLTRDFKASGIHGEVALIGQLFAQCLFPHYRGTKEEVARNQSYLSGLVKWKPSNDAVSAKYWILMKRYDECLKIGPSAHAPYLAAMQSFLADTAMIEASASVNRSEVDDLLFKIIHDKDERLRDSAVRTIRKRSPKTIPSVSQLAAALDAVEIEPQSTLATSVEKLLALVQPFLPLQAIEIACKYDYESDGMGSVQGESRHYHETGYPLSVGSKRLKENGELGHHAGDVWLLSSGKLLFLQITQHSADTLTSGESSGFRSASTSVMSSSQRELSYSDFLALPRPSIESVRKAVASTFPILNELAPSQ